MKKFSLFAAVAVTALALFAGDLDAACGGKERGRLLRRFRERRSAPAMSMSTGYSATYTSRVTVTAVPSAPVPPSSVLSPVVPRGASDDSSGWKRGPLPPNTWNWGGVVLRGMNPAQGFLMADFAGDHVKLYPSGKVVKAEDVDWYNNSLTLPPRR